LERLGLVRVQLLDAGPRKRIPDPRIEIPGNRKKARGARPKNIVVNEPLVGAAEFKQLAPRLGVPGRRHR
jgi:hypothetical protein